MCYIITEITLDMLSCSQISPICSVSSWKLSNSFATFSNASGILLILLDFNNDESACASKPVLSYVLLGYLNHKRNFSRHLTFSTKSILPFYKCMT